MILMSYSEVVRDLAECSQGDQVIITAYRTRWNRGSQHPWWSMLFMTSCLQIIKCLGQTAPSWYCNGANEEETSPPLYSFTKSFGRSCCDSWAHGNTVKSNQRGEAFGIFSCNPVFYLRTHIPRTHWLSSLNTCSVFLAMESTGMPAAPSIAAMLEMTPPTHTHTTTHPPSLIKFKNKR